MEQIIKQIKHFKKSLKDNSIKTYLVSLKKISKCVGDHSKFPEDPSFLRDTGKVFDCIKNEPDTTRKNRLSAIVVYLKSFEDDKNLKLIDIYSKEMERTAGAYQKIIDKQELTPKQKANIISMDEFKDVVNTIFDEIVKEKLYKKNELDNREYNLLQSYVLLRFYLEYPLRNDVSNTKIIHSKKEDDKKMNYLLVRDKSIYFILNVYKTAKKYGTKVFNLDEKLSKLIRLLLKHNHSGFLFTKYNRRDSLTSNDVSKLFSRIFMKYTNKRISTSLLRHIRASDMRKGDPTIKQEQEREKKIEDLFQHSGSTNNEYRKIG